MPSPAARAGVKKNEDARRTPGASHLISGRAAALSTAVPIRVSRSAWEELVSQARAAAPRECGGLLAGRFGRPTVIEACLSVANDAQGDKRFDSEPNSLIEAARQVRRMGLEVVGTYHSHPDADAVPSRADCVEGWHAPAIMVLVSVRDEVPEVRVWLVGEGSATELPCALSEGERRWWFLD